MLQEALEVLHLHDSTSTGLRLSLLLIGLIYVVHSYLRRRRQHEVSILCRYIRRGSELAVLGEYYPQSAVRLSAHENKISMLMASWS